MSGLPVINLPAVETGRIINKESCFLWLFCHIDKPHQSSFILVLLSWLSKTFLLLISQ